MDQDERDFYVNTIQQAIKKAQRKVSKGRGVNVCLQGRANRDGDITSNNEIIKVSVGSRASFRKQPDLSQPASNGILAKLGLKKSRKSHKSQSLRRSSSVPAINQPVTTASLTPPMDPMDSLDVSADELLGRVFTVRSSSSSEEDTETDDRFTRLTKTSKSLLSLAVSSEAPSANTTQITVLETLVNDDEDDLDDLALEQFAARLQITKQLSVELRDQPVEDQLHSDTDEIDEEAARAARRATLANVRAAKKQQEEQILLNALSVLDTLEDQPTAEQDQPTTAQAQQQPDEIDEEAARAARRKTLADVRAAKKQQEEQILLNALSVLDALEDQPTAAQDQPTVAQDQPTTEQDQLTTAQVQQQRDELDEEAARAARRKTLADVRAAKKLQEEQTLMSALAILDNLSG